MKKTKNVAYLAFIDLEISYDRVAFWEVPEMYRENEKVLAIIKSLYE